MVDIFPKPSKICFMGENVGKSFQRKKKIRPTNRKNAVKSTAFFKIFIWYFIWY